MESNGPAGLDAVCREHPEQADRLRRRVERLRDLGLLDGEPIAEVDLEAELPERLGEFRPLEVIGGGGMGLVVRAVQESLGREVALKIVRPDQLLFPGTRERFAREVETVSRLKHPGIVPVHGVFEDGGVPFFAMELVEGATLADVLARLASGDDARPETLDGRALARAVAEASGAGPIAEASAPAWTFRGSYVDACLRIVRQVADALAYAHANGVVHRDVKPSNVMVTPDGRAMLLDFGLSRPERAPRLTRTGSKLGSLETMAPEQVRGETSAIGPRTDVYALGVTLYELLTCRRPFAAGSEPQVTARILEGRPVPPRTRNPAVSFEAETVCLTAMELDAARRYVSAEAFARDVDNVLQRRPIEARRVSRWLRLRRFVERRPGEAAAAALLALVVVGGPLAYAWMKARALEELASRQARAERNFGLALEAVDTMLTRVGDETLRFVPEMDEVRRGLLEDALAFYRQFTEDAGEEFAVRSEAARLRVRVGQVRSSLGELDAAERATRTAIAELEELVRTRPDDGTTRRALAEAYGQLGGQLAETGRTDEAAAAAEAGLARLRAAPGPPSPEDRLVESKLVHVRGNWNFARTDVALASFREALAIADELRAEDPENVEVRVRTALSAIMLGTLLARVGEVGEAAEHSRRSVALLEGLVADDPGDRRHARTLAGTLYNLSGLLLESAPEEAEEQCERALEIWREERRRHPSAPRFLVEVATVSDRLAWLEHQRGRNEDAIRRLLDTAELLRAFVAEHPRLVDGRVQLGIALNSTSVQLRRLGREEEALRVADDGADVLSSLIEEVGPSVEALHHLGGLHHNAGRALSDLGDVDGASARFERAIDASTRALELEPSFAVARLYLRNHHWMLAESRITAGDPAGAAAAAERLPECAEDGPEEWRRAAGFVARAAWLAGGGEASAAYDRRALELLHEAAEHGWADVDDLVGCAAFARVRRLEAYPALLDRITAP
ncbi:MAG: protein kinase [Planctomycetota bacterium JB042]